MFNEDWATNGWCVDTPEHYLAPINVPVVTQYVEGDVFCPVEANQAIINSQVSTLSRESTWTDARKAGGDPYFVVSNDRNFVQNLIGALRQDEQADAESCDGTQVWA